MAKYSLTVDEYIKTKIRPEQKSIVVMVRKLMHECAPNAQEAISVGMEAGWTQSLERLEEFVAKLEV